MLSCSLLGDHAVNSSSQLLAEVVVNDERIAGEPLVKARTCVLLSQEIAEFGIALAAPRREPVICWSRNFTPALVLGSGSVPPSSRPWQLR